MATKKDRSKKKEQFKKQAKQQAAQQAIPKTHLVPVPTWQSNENLDMRGDLLEALEQQLMVAIEAVQKCGQVAQYVMQQNIKSEKIKINYVWNNGEPATEAEVEAHKGELEKLRKKRQAQLEKIQEQIQQEHNAAKTGLVGPDGQPIGTTQDLEEDNDEDTEESSDEQPSNDEQSSEE